MIPFAIVTGDFVRTGGMDRANFALASYLARSGHPVRLVAHRVAPELAALPGVTVRPARKPLGSYFLGRWPLRWAGLRVGRDVLAAGGRVVVNGGNCAVPDVNWVHYVHAAHRPDQAASRLRGWKGEVERRLDLRAERNAIRSARWVVCNSDRTRRDVIERLGAEPDRVRTIYYGTDPDQLAPATADEWTALRDQLGWPAKRPVVIFVGALGDRRKGFDRLFAAWSMLCKSSEWDAVLAVVGRGAELPRWRARTAAAGLDDAIRFLGFCDDVPELMRAADVLVAPSRYEAYGLGVHEALCCGLPAFVSASAGVAERYPPELADLLLPEPDDAHDLAARLRRWRARPDSFRARVAPLSARLRAYTWDDMAAAFVRTISET